jgi:hypothetical protein
MSSAAADPFWADFPQILIKTDRLSEFFPSKKLSRTENLNAITRLGIYISALLILYHSHGKYAFVGIFTALVIYFAHKNNLDIPLLPKSPPPSSVAPVESLQNTQCTSPTLDNPFMNATMKDYLNADPKTGAIVDRPPACNTNDPEIKKQMDKHFNNNLFKDVTDVFGKMNSQRQFFTMPWTTIPNDPQGEFAKWLYASKTTCKENADYCNPYEDLRAKRTPLVDPNVNPLKNQV